MYNMIKQIKLPSHVPVERAAFETNGDSVLPAGQIFETGQSKVGSIDNTYCIVLQTINFHKIGMGFDSKWATGPHVNRNQWIPHRRPRHILEAVQPSFKGCSYTVAV